MNKIVIIALSLAFSANALGMDLIGVDSNSKEIVQWLKEEVGRKWVLERIMPVGLVAWAGYDYFRTGGCDDKCRNVIEPLVVAGVLAGYRPLKKLLNAYKISISPQNSPRKIKYR